VMVSQFQAAQDSFSPLKKNNMERKVIQ